MGHSAGLHLSVVSPCVLPGKPEAARVVRTLLSAPSAIPTKYGYWEPIRRPFNVDDVEAALEQWPSDLLWRRDRPRVSGSFSWGGRHDGASVQLTAGLQDSLAMEVTGLLRRWAVQLRADLGLLHVLTAGDLTAGVQSGTVQYLDKERRHPVLTVFRPQLRRFCPDLYWATVLGPPYVELFGKERVRTVPAYHVEELAPEVFYIQLTREINTLGQGLENIETIRDRVKVHLGKDAFFSPRLGREHYYRVPRFELQQGLPPVDY